MKTNISSLAIPQLRMKFSKRETVQRGELWEFYTLQNPDLTERVFRRILYSLEKEKQITPLGAGIYALLNTFHATGKRKYNPYLSQVSHEIINSLKENFPYTQYLVWETRALHEFMVHQPAHNQIIVEIEKEAAESVFNSLKEQFSRNIFMQPDRITFERYILDAPESILILRLVTQSPRIKTKEFITARLEKILVDVFSDTERFFIFQGQELINIFENAFSLYWINTRTLWRYAGRRKAAESLMNFINNQTQIKSLEPTGKI